MRVYLDASVMVALALREPASSDFGPWLVENATERVISSFGWGEFVDAIARRVRQRALPSTVGSVIVSHYGSGSDTWPRRDTLDADVLGGAALISADLTRGLKLGDAIHLAACRRLNATLLTGDRQQAAAAAAFAIAHHLILPERT